MFGWYYISHSFLLICAHKSLFYGGDISLFLCIKNVRLYDRHLLFKLSIIETNVS